MPMRPVHLAIVMAVLSASARADARQISHPYYPVCYRYLQQQYGGIAAESYRALVERNSEPVQTCSLVADFTDLQNTERRYPGAPSGMAAYYWNLRTGVAPQGQRWERDPA
jgi:hypothetical protein